jgi:hypothetical protein
METHDQRDGRNLTGVLADGHQQRTQRGNRSKQKHEQESLVTSAATVPEGTASLLTSAAIKGLFRDEGAGRS